MANTSSNTGTSSQPGVVQLLPEVLGKGAFGKVYVGLYFGQRVAVKLVDRAFQPAGLLPADSRELEVMGRCWHPNIVRLLAACVKPPRPFLVMELMGIALDKLMHAEAATLLPMDLVSHGLVRVILHRDLKPANVLLNDPWSKRPVVKISDFGLSRIHRSVALTQSPEAGTPAYQAPECFDVDNYAISYKVDIYSFGVLLWEMLAGAHPWEGLGTVAIAFQIAFKGRRLPIPPSNKPGSCPARWPLQLCEMLQECWDQDPNRRPAAAELAKRLTLVRQPNRKLQPAPTTDENP
ncbi:putative serine/threonine-protein kinase [Tetrabaena socialis]|uniref:Putative serine/threonine-protein kinase n=1 Tax=Tetrabaena socialis TaxID=47790 RepID=A0A2J7ZZ12_9CHLO|nr:putative serine/threonine-protein kinase [Tetrabaena socialis]|eukprot:PNH05511.1 putative serine/threonine-protein kinase [Tetrabaena socialis]